MNVSRPALQRLEKAARRIAAHAYSPYSNFRVGAAVLSGRGKIFTGCNVENASFGLCNCAERTAIFNAISSGERKIKAVAVYTSTPTPTAPCGACRQVAHEFGPDAVILSVCDGSQRIECALDTLLPHAFGPEDLHRGEGVASRTGRQKRSPSRVS